MTAELFDVRSDGAVVLRVHVQPGAGRTAVRGRYGDALKVSVAAPPQGGRANQAVADLLASVLGVKPAAIALVGGETNRAKRFEVKGLEADDAADRLQRAIDDAERRPGDRDRF
ncbi:MAG TPA: DUF167 domain-containing protein [Acidimicrobiales bacterium]|nr:DUF167 domain-containing protein [Acidimicrobiales bacterium]